MVTAPVPGRPQRKKRPLFKSITEELDDSVLQSGKPSWKGDPTRWKDPVPNKVEPLDLTKDPGNGTPAKDGNTEGDGSAVKPETREEGTQAKVDVEDKSAQISEDEWEVQPSAEEL